MQALSIVIDHWIRPSNMARRRHQRESLERHITAKKQIQDFMADYSRWPVATPNFSMSEGETIIGFPCVFCEAHVLLLCWDEGLRMFYMRCHSCQKTLFNMLL